MVVVPGTSQVAEQQFQVDHGRDQLHAPGLAKIKKEVDTR